MRWGRLRKKHLKYFLFKTNKNFVLKNKLPIFDKCRTLISDNKPERAIKELIELNIREESDALTMVKSDLRRLNEAKIIGTISLQDYQARMNRINQGILAIIKRIEEDLQIPESNSVDISVELPKYFTRISNGFIARIEEQLLNADDDEGIPRITTSDSYILTYLFFDSLVKVLEEKYPTLSNIGSLANSNNRTALSSSLRPFLYEVKELKSLLETSKNDHSTIYRKAIRMNDGIVEIKSLIAQALNNKSKAVDNFKLIEDTLLPALRISVEKLIIEVLKVKNTAKIKMTE